MDTNDPTNESPAARWLRLWQAGSAPDLDAFLAEAGDLSPIQLAAVLHVDQRERWRRGQHIPAEAYLQRHPRLLDDEEGTADLVYGEFLLREQQGAAPPLEELLWRFPKLAAILKPQIELHRALQAAATPRAAEAETTLPAEALVHERAPRTDPLGPVVPGYEVLGELGRGAMGVVYKARQVKADRLVALKMIGGGDEKRFQTEIEAVAQLQHPNVVQVYEVGEQDGVPFFSMEFVDGGGLDMKLAGTPLRPRAAASLVETLARAMHYTHQRGVLHRDLKPANVLLTADGVPKISDFGLARRLENESGLTQTGLPLGTPSYMSPEQAAGQTAAIGPLTDVYALGAILYECLTGRPPFRGATIADTLDQVRFTEPVPPRQLQPTVPRDLETICLKCLQKEPHKRYASTAELAEDLRRFQAGEPIKARRAGPVTRLRKWVRRHPGLAVALGCVAVLTLVAAFAAYQAHRAEHKRLAERAQLLAEKLDKALLVATSGDLAAAEKAIREAELAGASPGQVRLLRGQVALFRGDMEAAIEQLEQAVKLLPDSVAARGLLAAAYCRAEQFERFAEIQNEVKQLAPITPEDYLFKGYAMAGPEGLPSMDEAIRRRDSPIARLLRAEARSIRATRTADPSDAERALEDASRAKGMLPDNPYALVVSVLAHLVAAGAYADAGQPEKSRAALLQAEQDDRALDRFPPLPSIAWYRFAYLHYVGRKDVALEVLRRCHEKSNDHQTAFSFGVALSEQGDFAKALQVLDRRARRHDVAGDILRAYVLAELPDGPARALTAYKEMTARYHKETNAPFYAQTILRLLGRKAEAVAACLEVRRSADPSDDFMRAGFLSRTELDYNCELVSADELLRVAGADRGELVRCHYDIALTKLADGDRAGAREHFQKCLATRFFLSWKFDWSRMFLAHMDKDPNWPPWIPVKKE